MDKSSSHSEKRSWLNTFSAAWEGIAYAVRTQRNMKVHLTITCIVCVIGALIGLRLDEWRWIGLCITLVLAAEVVNTAIESVVDLVSPEWHQLAKVAKDAAAGAVLITVIFSVVVGISVFAKPILSMLVNLFNN